jgi:DNA-binding LacI/PurR family transcriptional regulator
MPKRIPTLIDVAKKCNLSVATVSRALSGTGYVSEKSKTRIQLEAKKLGYTVNSKAMGLRKGASRTLGLIVEDITVLDFGIFADSVCRAASENGYKVIVCVANEDEQLESDAISLLISSRVDGIIAIPTSRNISLWKRALEHKIRLQFVDRSIPELKSIPVITSDHRHAGFQVASNFIEDNRANAVYLLPNLLYTGQLLKDGILEAYSKASVKINHHQIVIINDHRTPDMHTIFDELIERKVDGVFCGSFVIADAMLKESLKIKSGKLQKIPKIAYTDRSWIGGVTPEIAILDNDFEKLGRLSVINLLRDLAEGKQIPSRSAAPVKKVSPTLFRLV